MTNDADARPIVVAGATGNVGREVVAQLAAAGRPVRALVRRPGSVPGAPGVEAVVADLSDPDSLAPAFAGAEAVFWLSGYDRMAETLAAMKRGGVDRVALLSSGSVVSGDLTNAVAAYHIRSEEAVVASGLAWTFVRPSSFMSNTYRWIAQLAAGDLVRLPFADVPIAMVDPADVAAVCVAALRSPAHAGMAYPVTGPEALRPAEQVETVGAVLGRPLRFEAVGAEEARAEMSRTTPAQYVDAFFRFFDQGEIDETTVRPTVAQVTGRPPGTFADWVRAHADALRERIRRAADDPS